MNLWNGCTIDRTLAGFSLKEDGVQIFTSPHATIYGKPESATIKFFLVDPTHLYVQNNGWDFKKAFDDYQRNNSDNFVTREVCREHRLSLEVDLEPYRVMAFEIEVSLQDKQRKPFLSFVGSDYPIITHSRLFGEVDGHIHTSIHADDHKISMDVRAKHGWVINQSRIMILQTMFGYKEISQQTKQMGRTGSFIASLTTFVQANLHEWLRSSEFKIPPFVYRNHTKRKGVFLSEKPIGHSKIKNNPFFIDLKDPTHSWEGFVNIMNLSAVLSGKKPIFDEYRIISLLKKVR